MKVYIVKQYDNWEAGSWIVAGFVNKDRAEEYVHERECEIAYVRSRLEKLKSHMHEELCYCNDEEMCPVCVEYDAIQNEVYQYGGYLIEEVEVQE